MSFVHLWDEEKGEIKRYAQSEHRKRLAPAHPRSSSMAYHDHRQPSTLPSLWRHKVVALNHMFNSEPIANLSFPPTDPERDLSPNCGSAKLLSATCCHPFINSCPKSASMLGRICENGILYVGLVHASNRSSGPIRADVPIIRSTSLGTGIPYSPRERRNICCKGPARG